MHKISAQIVRLLIIMWILFGICGQNYVYTYVCITVTVCMHVYILTEQHYCCVTLRVMFTTLCLIAVDLLINNWRPREALHYFSFWCSLLLLLLVLLLLLLLLLLLCPPFVFSSILIVFFLFSFVLLPGSSSTSSPPLFPPSSHFFFFFSLSSSLLFPRSLPSTVTQIRTKPSSGRL